MTAFMLKTGWRCWLSCMLAGLVASFSLTPVYGGGGMAWLMLVPLLALGWPFYALTGGGQNGAGTARAGRACTKRAFVMGHGAGFGWFVYSLSWISHSMLVSDGSHTPFIILLVPFTIASLPLAFGIFWGAGFALAARLGRNPPARLFMAVAMLAIMEYVRGFIFTGLPWNAPGMAFGNIGLAAASLVGLWGLTFIALSVAACPVFFALGHVRAGLVMALVGLAVPFLPALPAPPDNRDAVMTVRLVQPSISQDHKWRRERRKTHLTALVELSRSNVGRPADVIVWPETAFEGFLEREPRTIGDVARLAGGGESMLITGVLRAPNPGVFHNAMSLHDTDGATRNIYDKQKLVPFGEYLPMRGLIPFADIIVGPNDFTAGPHRDMMVVTTRDGGAVELLPLICYEVIFPGSVRRMVLDNAPDAIVTISNDAWFGDTQGPHQHLAAARMRAAELGIPVIRVANTGISAVIDAAGAISAKTAYGEAVVLDAAIGPGRKTLYALWGDMVFWLLVAGAVIAGFTIKGLTANKQPPE